MYELYEWLLNAADKYIGTIYKNSGQKSAILFILNKKEEVISKYGSIDEIKINESLNKGKALTEEKLVELLKEADRNKRPQKILSGNFLNSNKHIVAYASPIIIKNDTIGFFLVIALETSPLDVFISNLELTNIFLQDLYSGKIEEKKLMQEYKYEKSLAEMIPMGYMAVDREGIIKYLNKPAFDILGVGEEAIGKNLREITDFEPELFEVLETGVGWTDKEFIIDMKTKKNLHLVKTCVPVFDNENNVIGVIDTFNEIKNVKNLVNKITGAKARFTFDNIIYTSDKMDRVVRFAKKIASYDSSVLIQGESGTGKELFAHSIHQYSNRRKGPFVTIDCSALPHDLIESELFGYVEGAFTGARRGGRPGKFEMGNGGTIFLDEIGEMLPETQKKLLRVLQTHTITRIGDHVPISIDIRVIAATNRNLEEEVKEKNFREDLFYRLNVIHLQVPSLRERKEDIIPVAEFFVKEIGNRIGKENVYLAEDVKDILQAYHWPGNIRQLNNVIERCMNLVEGKIITRDLLPSSIFDNNMRLHDRDIISGLSNFEKLEREGIMNMLHRCNGNKTKAAQELGIARSTLYLKMDKYNIEG